MFLSKQLLNFAGVSICSDYFHEDLQLTYDTVPARGWLYSRGP